MPLRRSARLWDLDTWGEVWSSMRRNKLRVFLTACGVFWGMLMLTLLLGFGAGLQHGVQRDFMGLARYLVFIAPSIFDCEIKYGQSDAYAEQNRKHPQKTIKAINAFCECGSLLR